MLKVHGLCKNYKGFRLDNVSFSLPAGYIMGFIGTNGAGKSTTIKAIVNMIAPDAGDIEILGMKMPQYEAEIKEDIGIMLSGYEFYVGTKVKKIISEFRPFFHNWDAKLCARLIEVFGIDVNKRYMQLSNGMKAKLGLVLAMSHNPKLLILDEPTSGLDPAARDTVLDILREFVEDGTKSVLFSTHITSDLDKCADYIVMIENGKLVANDTKDNLIDAHLVVKGGIGDLTEDLKARLIGIKQNDYGFSALILKNQLTSNDHVSTQPPNIEDLMLYYSKGGLSQCKN